MLYKYTINVLCKLFLGIKKPQNESLLVKAAIWNQKGWFEH